MNSDAFDKRVDDWIKGNCSQNQPSIINNRDQVQYQFEYGNHSLSSEIEEIYPKNFDESSDLDETIFSDLWKEEEIWFAVKLLDFVGSSFESMICNIENSTASPSIDTRSELNKKPETSHHPIQSTSNTMQESFSIIGPSKNLVKKFKCTHEDCKAIFTSKNHKRRHELSVHKPPIKCPYENCDKSIKRTGMNLHIKQYHSDKSAEPNRENTVEGEIDDGKFPCFYKKCYANFPTGAKRRDHFRAVHQSRVSCTFEDCDSFVKPMHLKKHIQEIHEKIRRQCDKCKKWLTTHDCRFHFKICDGIEGSDETGSESLKPKNRGNCSNSVNVPEHVRIWNEKIKMQCKNCKKWFARACLRKHYDRCTSNGEKKFQCTYEGCQASFTTKGNRSSHVDKVHKSSKKKNKI